MREVHVEIPAKTNLTLGVGEAHDEWDGRHELDTIYCSVGIFDTIVAKESDGLELHIDGADAQELLELGTDNLAVQAVLAMAETAKHVPNVSLTITKRIPVAAGLGGGSADAAATILALNRLWQLKWSINRLRNIASNLGADVPFCLTGGLAHGTGYGDRINEIADDSAEAWNLRLQGYAGDVLIAAYDAHVSTADVYHTFDTVGAGEGEANHLQQAAVQLHPRSGKAVELAKAAGATQAFVSGSGPSVVAFVPDDAVAAVVEAQWRLNCAADRIIRAKAPVQPAVRVTL